MSQLTWKLRPGSGRDPRDNERDGNTKTVASGKSASPEAAECRGHRGLMHMLTFDNSVKVPTSRSGLKIPPDGEWRPATRTSETS